MRSCVERTLPFPDRTARVSLVLESNQDDSPDESLENAAAVTTVPQMTHPRSISASLIDSFTVRDSPQVRQTNVYSSSCSLSIVSYSGRFNYKRSLGFPGRENIARRT
jgi:hypothetical protein